MGVLVCFCTCPDRPVADRLAEALVTEGLAAWPSALRPITKGLAAGAPTLGPVAKGLAAWATTLGPVAKILPGPVTEIATGRLVAKTALGAIFEATFVTRPASRTVTEITLRPVGEIALGAVTEATARGLVAVTTGRAIAKILATGRAFVAIRTRCAGCRLAE